MKVIHGAQGKALHMCMCMCIYININIYMYMHMYIYIYMVRRGWRCTAASCLCAISAEVASSSSTS